MQLDTLSLAELRDLRGRVDRAIASFEDRKRREALAVLEEQARGLGFSLSDLTGNGRKRRGAGNGPAKGVAKYVNPENSAETWSGRGRRPAWVNAALEAGQGLDDLAI